MPRPTRLDNYPGLFRIIAERFQTGEATNSIEIHCEDIFNPSRGETPESCAIKTRFKWYGFKKALEKVNHPLVSTVNALELTIKGSVIAIQNRDESGFARALEASLERRGIRVYTPKDVWESQERVRATRGEPSVAYDMGKAREELIDRLASEGPVIPDNPQKLTADEQKAIEREILSAGVASTKKFEQTMEDLGFTAHPSTVKKEVGG